MRRLQWALGELTWCQRNLRPRVWVGLPVPRSLELLPVPALHPLLGPYLHYLPLCLLLSIPSTVGSQPRLGALWGQALNKCEVLLPLPLLSGLHLPLWLTQGSGSLLKQEQRWPRYHPHQDPDPSAQTVRAESDSFIRFLKGRAGHWGKGQNPVVARLEQAVHFRDFSELGARSHRPRGV